MSDSKHGLSADEVKAIAEAKKKYMDALMEGSVSTPELARAYHDLALNILLGDHVEGGVIPGPTPGCGVNPDPDNEHVKDLGKGWGGNTGSPELWKSTPHVKEPEKSEGKYKVVDDQGTNIAHRFDNQQDADNYIKYYKCLKEQGIPGEPATCPEGQHRDTATGKCVPNEPGPGPGPTGDTPYPPKSDAMNHTVRRAVRHYASGADDDETIEANVKSIKHRRHQFVVDLHVPKEMEHDDNLSLKLGGTHMGTGWFDHSFSIYKGRTGLGKEEDHPSTDLFVEEGTAIGDLRDKKMKIAATYDADTNHTELWHNLGDGWKKDLEGTDVGGFNPKASTFECQLRIDGFKKGEHEGKPPEPEIFSAIVTAI